MGLRRQARLLEMGFKNLERLEESDPLYAEWAAWTTRQIEMVSWFRNQYVFKDEPEDEHSA